MNRKLNILGVMIAVFTLVGPVALAAQEKAWSIRAEGLWVNPDVDFSQIDEDGDRVTASANGALGFALGLEYRFSRRFGIDLGYQIASPEIEVVATSGSVPGLQVNARDEIEFRPLTLALDIHLTPDSAVDLKIAPVLAWVSYGDLNLRLRSGGEVVDSKHFRAEDDLAIGARLAFDYGFGDGPWSLRASALYLQTELVLIDDQGESERLELDPVVLSVGVGYRF